MICCQHCRRDFVTNRFSLTSITLLFHKTNNISNHLTPKKMPMKAMVLRQKNEPFVLEERPDPKAGPGEEEGYAGGPYGSRRFCATMCHEHVQRTHFVGRICYTSEPIAKPAYSITPAKARVQNSLKRLDSSFRRNDAEGLLQLALCCNKFFLTHKALFCLFKPRKSKFLSIVV